MINVFEFLPQDLSADGDTNNFYCSGRSPFSIQPVTSSLTGNPTYTLQVSNDGINFVDFDATTTNLAITDQIQSDYDVFPWNYLRLSVSSNSATGTVIFKVWEG